MSLVIKCQSITDLLKAMKSHLSDYQVHYPAPDEKGIDRFFSLEHTGKENLEALESSINQTLFKNQPVLMPPKGFLLPETEYLLRFFRQGDSADFTPEKVEDQTHVILGIKSCDLSSFNMLDEVFLSEPEDTRYRKRREQTLTIATPCESESIYCFCGKFGVNKHVPSGADIILVKEDKETETNHQESSPIYLQAASEKGEQLLQELIKSTEKDSQLADRLEEISDPPPSLKAALGEEVSGVSHSDESSQEDISLEKTRDRMEELFESPIWDELAMRCLNCGICTYYCPTCHCFDIQDFYRGQSGTRYRKWDSCMFCNYSEMAAGHNPRMNKKDRLRNRFFHKLNYLPKTNGIFGCVGCGRCLKHCPVGISINTVLEKIGGEKVEK